MTSIPAWLSHFQSSFAEAMRSPLVESANQIVYHPELTVNNAVLQYISDTKPLQTKENKLIQFGLPQYNKQYWFRIFSALHSELPLTTHLLSPYTLNLMILNLLSHRTEAPPLPSDLNQLSNFFIELVQKKGKDDPWFFSQYDKNLQKALKIDQFLSQSKLPSRVMDMEFIQKLTDEEFENLRLKPNSNWLMMEDSWELLKTSYKLRSAPSSKEKSEFPFSSDKEGLHALLVRQGNTTEFIPIGNLCALFFEYLQRDPIGDAIDKILKESSEEQLEESLSKWLIQSLKLNMWMV